MKNRSTRKNKTRNFRGKNKGGAKGKNSARSTAKSTMSNMVAKASDTSSHTTHRLNLNRMSHHSRPIGAGDENKVYMMGFWNNQWTEILETVIAPGVFALMTVQKDIKKK